MTYKLSSTCQIPDLDKIYYKYFGEISKGFFIEVGAFDGEQVSNTSCLADLGWRGIYIEPVFQHYVQCLKRHHHNNVTVSDLAIGIDEGEQEVYSSGIVSTLDKEQSEFVSKMGIFNYPDFKSSTCYQMRFDRFLQKHGVERNFDLLVVDVEGREEDVFGSFDLSYWRPKMMIIELIDDHSYFKENIKLTNSCQKLRQYINNTGYSEVYRDHINTIFVSNDCQ